MEHYKVSPVWTNAILLALHVKHLHYVLMSERLLETVSKVPLNSSIF